jgi:hypothetical protein
MEDSSSDPLNPLTSPLFSHMSVTDSRDLDSQHEDHLSDGSTLDPMTFPIDFPPLDFPDTVSVRVTDSPDTQNTPDTQDPRDQFSHARSSFSSMSSSSFDGPHTYPVFCCTFSVPRSRVRVESSRNEGHLAWIKTSWRSMKNALNRLVSGPHAHLDATSTPTNTNPMHAELAKEERGALVCGSPEPLVSVTLTKSEGKSPHVAFDDSSSLHSWTSAQDAVGHGHHAHINNGYVRRSTFRLYCWW